MGKDEQETREGFERWVDERIRAALSNLSGPLATQVGRLQKRVDQLKDRFQMLARKLDCVSPKKPEDG